MKFATRLDFNAHPDWKDSYINYEKLKKLIYAKEIEETRGHSLAIPGSDNRTSLGTSLATVLVALLLQCLVPSLL
jgi:SPX domain protein involved in polyphosphate accumulation